MNDNPRTSGDMVADRRFAYAEGYAEEGDHIAAADLVRQALELAPDWVPGWFRLGEYLEKAGSADAVAAYAKCLELAPADHLGAALKLALLENRKEAKPALAYAEALFDDYAAKFDSALVGKLGYRVPQLLRAMLDDNLPGSRFEDVLDLGCGTGLMAAEVRARCERIVGVDLSAAMLDEARAKGLYEQLHKADLVDALTGASNLSLILAADVFMYLPALDGVIGAAANATADGGHFLFSVEKALDADGWTLLPSRRHAHGKAYVQRLLADNGFVLVDQREDVIRMDAGEPLTGLLWLARLDRSKP